MDESNRPEKNLSSHNGEENHSLTPALDLLIPEDIRKRASGIVETHKRHGSRTGKALVNGILEMAGYNKPGDSINVDRLLRVASNSVNIHFGGLAAGGAGRYEDLEARRVLYGDLDTAVSELNRRNQQGDADRVRSARDSLRAMFSLLRLESVWSANSRDADGWGKIKTAAEKAREGEAGSCDLELFCHQLSGETVRGDWQEVMKEFGLIMANRTYNEDGDVIDRNRPYTHAEMMRELRDRLIKSNMRDDDPKVWARLLAWSLYRVTGGLAIEDPNISVIAEDKGVKKVCGNPLRALFIEQRRKADFSVRTLDMLETPVEPIEVHDMDGNVIGTHGLNLDGTPMRHVDMFGMGVLWLELSKMKVNGKEGGFWLLQPFKTEVLKEVIARHEREGITDAMGDTIEVPIDAEDLRLVNWTRVRTAMREDGNIIPLLNTGVYENWLENGDFTERSRAMIEPLLAAIMEGLPGIQKAAELAGELSDKDVGKTTIFYSHLPNERARAEIAFLKSMALDLYLRWAEWEEARERKFQERTNTVVAHLGGDAITNENIWLRDLSGKSLLAEPPSIFEAATWLLRLGGSNDEIKFEATGADKIKIGIPGFRRIASTQDVINMAGNNFTWWRPERLNQTFYQWLQEIAADYPEKTITRQELNQLVGLLTNGPDNGSVRARNLVGFLNEFSIPIVRYSFLQQNFIDNIARNSISYYEAELPDKYKKYLQYEAIVKAMIDNLDAYTPGKEGERVLKLLYAGIYGNSFDRKYTKPPGRMGANVNTILETNDRRLTDFVLMHGHPDWTNIAYHEFGRKPVDEKGLPVWEDEAYDDVGLRRLIMEYARKRSELISAGEMQVGFYDFKTWKKDLKKWWCTDTDVVIDGFEQIFFGVVDKSNKELKQELERGNIGQLGYKAFKMIPLVGGVADAFRAFNAGPWITSGADVVVWGSFAYPLAQQLLTGAIWEAQLPIIGGTGEILFNQFPLIGDLLGKTPLIAFNARGIVSAFFARNLLLSARIPLLGWRPNLHGVLAAKWLEFNPLGRWIAVRSVNNPDRGEQVKNGFQNLPL